MGARLLVAACAGGLAALCGWQFAAHATFDVIGHDPPKGSLSYLLEACSPEERARRRDLQLPPLLDCEAYIQGVLDSFRELNALLPAAQKACFSEWLQAWQVARDLRAITEYWKYGSASSAIIETLRKEHPCE